VEPVLGAGSALGPITVIVDEASARDESVLGAGTSYCEESELGVGTDDASAVEKLVLCACSVLGAGTSCVDESSESELGSGALGQSW